MRVAPVFSDIYARKTEDRGSIRGSVRTTKAHFRRLFDSHHEAIQRYCFRRLPTSDANDTVAEVFLVAWRHISDAPTGNGELPWLYCIGRNAVANAVHALEHRAVVVWYSEDNGEIAAGLREIVLKFDDHVILSPNNDLDRPVVATAWNRLKSYDNVDPEIEDFINTYRRRGPEQVPYGY